MYSKIPESMQTLNQWVCVKNGTKVPFSAVNEGPVSVSASHMWSDFKTAVQAVQAGIYDGIGFVFADTGLIGIDIDTGFSDGLLTPLAADIIGSCKSYTEVSRSGRGMHIIMEGTIPFDGANNHEGVEIYKTGRYFITTGRQMIFSDIRKNQQAIDHILDQYFPASTRESTQNRAYTAVWPSPQPHCIPLRPEYPEIGAGERNLSLASIAGQLHSGGYPINEIYRELLRVNSSAVNPPLPIHEIRQITRSVTRYER